MKELTLGALAQAYLSLGLHGRESQREYESIFRRFFSGPEWAEQPLSAIKRFQVMKLNQSLAPYPDYGNKVIGFIKRAYSWGQDTINPETDRPYWEGENPAWRITRHDCLDRERVMDHAEITLLLQQIDYFDLKYQAFYLCRLLVPCRLKELCLMRRDAVSGTGKWLKGKTKNGRPHTIYIAHQAMAALMTLQETWFDRHTCTRIPHTYFFPGQYGQPLSPNAVQKMWRHHRAELDMPDLWLLDFRRTLHTYLYRIMKVDDLTAKALLNHYDARPVARYVRLDYDYLAGILQGYADWLWQFKQEVPHAEARAFSLGPCVRADGLRHVGGGAGQTASAATMVEQSDSGSTSAA